MMFLGKGRFNELGKKKRNREVMGTFTMRAYVLYLTTALCRKRRRHFLLLRETQRRLFRLCVLVSKEFRDERLSRVTGGHHGVTRSFSEALLYRHSERGITEMTNL